MKLFTRKLLKQIQGWIAEPDMLAILGPKQVGKTTLLKLLHQDIKETWGDQKDILVFDLDDPEHLTALNRDPRYFKEFCLFSGADSKKDWVVMIDEIQNLKDPSRFLNGVTATAPVIKLIVTGSISFAVKKFTQEMPDRKKVFTLLPLDFEEFLCFKGLDDLCALKNRFNFRRFINNQMDLALEDVTPFKQEMRMLFEEFILYGGYPEVVLARSKAEKLKRLRELVEAFELKSVNVSFNVANISAFRSFYKLMAGGSGDLLNVNRLARTLRIGRDTVRRYLDVVAHSFMVYELMPFHNNHPKELKKMPKFYFGDTGLRNLAISNFTELRFRPDKEQLFENTICCELVKNLKPADRLYFWRTISRNEVEFVISGEHNLAFEVKSSANAQLKKSSGFRAFDRIYPKFKQFVINFEQFSSQDKTIFLPGWMI